MLRVASSVRVTKRGGVLRLTSLNIERQDEPDLDRAARCYVDVGDVFADPLVPRSELVAAGRDVGKDERAIRRRCRVKGMVEHHDSGGHIRVEMAVDLHHAWTREPPRT